MLNNIVIRRDVAQKDRIFGFAISKRKYELSAGTVDNTVESVYKEVCLQKKWHTFGKHFQGIFKIFYSNCMRYIEMFACQCS